MTKEENDENSDNSAEDTGDMTKEEDDENSGSSAEDTGEEWDNENSDNSEEDITEEAVPRTQGRKKTMRGRRR